MIVPNDPYRPKTRKDKLLFYGVIPSVMLMFALSVGMVIVNEINNMPPSQFTIINMEYFAGNPPWVGEEYRVYFDSSNYVLTTKNDFAKFQIGDWFNGTILVFAYI